MPKTACDHGDSMLEVLCAGCARDCFIETALRERERLAKLFEDEAKAAPLGQEDIVKGRSVYNWLMHAARKIRESKAEWESTSSAEGQSVEGA